MRLPRGFPRLSPRVLARLTGAVAMALALACGSGGVVGEPVSAQTRPAGELDAGAPGSASVEDAAGQTAASGDVTDAVAPEASAPFDAVTGDASPAAPGVKGAPGCSLASMEWGPDNALPDGGTGCIGRWNATCAGQSYEVDCSCPEGACVCFGAT